MSNRGVHIVADLVASVLVIAVAVAVFGGSLWLAMWFSVNVAPFDETDMNCSDVEIDDDRAVEMSVLYYEDQGSAWSSNYVEGAIVIFEDGSVTVSGPLQEYGDGSGSVYGPGFAVVESSPGYLQVDRHEREIRVGPSDPSDSSAVPFSTQESLPIYETCDVSYGGENDAA